MNEQITAHQPSVHELTVHNLNTAERLLLISFRLWALPIAVPNRVHMDWRAGFRVTSIDQIACSIFDALLNTLFSSTRRVIEVHREMCAGISLDEREFIRCIGLHQNDHIDAAADVLANWVRPEAIHIAASHAAQLAEAMRGAGLFLPLREDEPMLSRAISAGVGHGLHFLH